MTDTTGQIIASRHCGSAGCEVMGHHRDCLLATEIDDAIHIAVSALERERLAHADTRRHALAAEATLARLTRTSAETVAVVEAAKLVVRDHTFNAMLFGCGARPGESLETLRNALDALAAKEAQTNAQ